MVNTLPGRAGSGRMQQHLLKVSGASWVSNPNAVGGEITEKRFNNVVFLRSCAQQDTLQVRGALLIMKYAPMVEGMSSSNFPMDEGSIFVLWALCKHGM